MLAVSGETRNQLISDLGVAPERIHVAPTGVPPEFFIERDARSEELRLLFLGSLSAEKNPHAALDVAEHLDIDQPVHLRFVGAGPLQEELAERAGTGADGVVVELAGSVENVMPHLAWADLLILCSRTEGLPGAVLEAGAAGVPALAFDVGGTGETMVDGTSGILVPPGDNAGMAAAAQHLATDRAKLLEMGTAQQDFVRSRYTLDAAIKRFDQYLTAALEERP